MVSSLRSHLKFSNVMGALAVFLVLGGSAFALGRNTVGTKQLKKGAVTTKKIRNNAVVGKKVKESSLSPVPSAKSANPIAFARVSKGGGVIEAQSKGVADANVAFHGNPGDGTYCFSGLGFTPKGGQVTIDFRDSAFQTAQLGIGTAGGCPQGSQAIVVTYTGNMTSDAGFFIAFHR